ncbi:MAG: hypothetical protein ACYTJ0_15560 [Planctomycetota bacterium]|jgi:hypothetical protein
MTGNSADRYRQRADLTLQHLRQAAQAVTVLERLDREAVRLGLEPTCSRSRLAAPKAEVQSKYAYCLAERNRGTVSTFDR